MTKIKMCGLRRREDIEYANRLLPDYIGYVFAKSSKRYVSPEKAAGLTELLDKRIVPVGVFVDSDFDEIYGIVSAGTIRAVQLHGSEPDELVRRLQNEGITVIRAFRIKTPEDTAGAERSCADFILLDSGGGSGEVFDWSLISGIKRDYFLAGGLTAGNAAQAIKKLAPYAVDASSCLETEGFKDFGKMAAFAEAVRNA